MEKSRGVTFRWPTLGQEIAKRTALKELASVAKDYSDRRRAYQLMADHLELEEEGQGQWQWIIRRGEERLNIGAFIRQQVQMKATMFARDENSLGDLPVSLLEKGFSERSTPTNLILPKQDQQGQVENRSNL